MNILAVTANGRQELAGAGIASFAGFFSRKYREHDYTVGRNKARKYLAGRDVKNILGLTGMDVDLPISPTLPGLAIFRFRCGAFCSRANYHCFGLWA